MGNRVMIVRTAQHWYDAAWMAKQEGRPGDAFACMENALNHTENALSALLQSRTFTDAPPMSGKPRRTLDEMRTELDALRS